MAPGRARLPPPPPCRARRRHDAVDEAGQSARAVEQRLDGGRLEQGKLAAGQTQAVGEAGVEFLAVECAEVVTHDEALGIELRALGRHYPIIIVSHTFHVGGPPVGPSAAVAQP